MSKSKMPLAPQALLLAIASGGFVPVEDPGPGIGNVRPLDGWLYWVTFDGGYFYASAAVARGSRVLELDSRDGLRWQPAFD